MFLLLTRRITDPLDYARAWFNLNNLPRAPGSILREVVEDVDGMNVPWLYMGMLFATFCWHNEDHHLNSCSYHHEGAPKTWCVGEVYFFFCVCVCVCVCACMCVRVC